MKHIIIFVIIYTKSLFSIGQINKNNFIVGGNGSFNSQKETQYSGSSKSISIKLIPDIGYFFFDKFAAGIRSHWNFTKISYSGSLAKSGHLGVGPFFRYYFLDNSNQINFFAESAYQYINNWGNNYSDYSNLFLFSAGPEIFINTNIGIEITGNYDFYKNNNMNKKAKGCSLNIGLKIHLENNNN